MPNLISILNSGESLEKSIVLTKLALEHNPNFYSNYKKITILYSENLPKKRKGSLVHGTIGGLIKNLNDKTYLKYRKLEDLWEDRQNILRIIQNEGRISERVTEKLMQDKKRFDKIIPNLPWHLIIKDFKNLLVNQFLDNPQINLEFLDIKKNSEEIFKKTPLMYDGLIRLNLLNPEGLISSKTLWKEYKFPESEILTRKDKKQLEPLNKSIVLSPNVFMFLLGVYNFNCHNGDNSLIGFRKFNKTKRISYDKGIKFIQNRTNYVEEPQNKLFNNLLDKVDKNYGNLPIERKLNYAIYDYLNRNL